MASRAAEPIAPDGVAGARGMRVPQPIGSAPKNADMFDDPEEEEEVFGTFPSFLTAESDTPSESGTEGLTWISWFCSLSGHQYFSEVAEDFIEDDFNLTGLNFLVPFYREALEMILDIEPRTSHALTHRRRLAENTGCIDCRVVCRAVVRLDSPTLYSYTARNGADGRQI